MVRIYVELKKNQLMLHAFDPDQILNELIIRESTWYFSPTSEAHFSGAWKRLIRSVKVLLKVILEEECPNKDTLLTKIEHTDNSRPLTLVSDNAEDPDCITLNHFLIGSCQSH